MTDWAHIVEEYGPLVWKTVYRIVSNEADAADCFQRAFLSALELSRNETIGNWAGLLQRMATARALDRLRVRYRDIERTAALPHGLAADARRTDPSRQVSAIELEDQLRQALCDIDERQAHVFCLARLDGWSYSEIAEELGLTTNHVGVLLNRARSRLQELLRGFVQEGDRSHPEIPS